ncbi:MAG TPA: RluA family pseudouridine synthase [Patescibacteria group bacterium]|nr:RluA family pseudouridine synthase [Patescibacteria group bacterium]
MRLDKYLVEKIPNISRSRIQQTIKDTGVLVNGEKILEPDFEITETHEVLLPEFKTDDLKPSDIELKVVFENNDLAVIDKPAGMVVHPGAGNTEDTLANALLAKYPGIEKVGEPHRPGIVHRLDEDTSGLIVIAKTQAAYDYLKQMFLDRSVDKEYLALVRGTPNKHGIIDAPLERVPLKQKMSVRDGSASGGKIKQAITEYFLVASDLSLQFSLIRVKLHTGRTHQIRAHLAHIGHPIIGDAVYGSKSDLVGRQFLHAYKLKFKLMDRTWIELVSTLPADLKEALSQLNISYDDQLI